MSKRGLDDFCRRWEISRLIRETAGAAHHLRGHVDIMREGDGARYLEEGILQTANGQELKACRVYLWGENAAGMIEVSFEDGRAFHRFDPNQSQQKDQHYCAPDQYDVRYDFSIWPIFTCTWQVRGPKKSYVMETEFRPQPVGS